MNRQEFIRSKGFDLMSRRPNVEYGLYYIKLEEDKKKKKKKFKASDWKFYN